MGDLDDTVLLATLMEAADDAIVISDAEGQIRSVNRAASRMFQRDPAEMIGQNLRRLITNGLKGLRGGPTEDSTDANTHEPGRTLQEVDGVRADGTALPILLSVARTSVAQGEAVISIMRDLTERRAMEAAAARSQRMDAIGRMTGGISHDFNNLLAVIIGNLELIGGGPLSDPQRRQLADALSAAELGADLTSRLMVFARKSDLKVRPIDLNAETGKAHALLRHTIGTHCEIAVSEQADLWPVAVDQTRLQTALLNLAMNSQDAMPEGGILTIETRNIDIDDTYMAQEIDVAPGRYVRLSVSDNGHGMTADERIRALEPFFTTKATGHGTGLGLSMVYGFVKQLGGYLTIYSEPGEGTVVALYFPALEAGIATGTSDNAAAARIHAPAARRRILVVEDNAELRHLSMARLSTLGFDCDSAASGDDALKRLQDGETFALVFTDMVMPGTLSGYDLARRIRTDWPDVAVLLTSGFSEVVLRDRKMGAEFSILRKPYRQAELERAIFAELEVAPE